MNQNQIGSNWSGNNMTLDQIQEPMTNSCNWKRSHVPSLGITESRIESCPVGLVAEAKNKVEPPGAALSKPRTTMTHIRRARCGTTRSTVLSVLPSDKHVYVLHACTLVRTMCVSPPPPPPHTHTHTFSLSLPLTHTLSLSLLHTLSSLARTSW